MIRFFSTHSIRSLVLGAALVLLAAPALADAPAAVSNAGGETRARASFERFAQSWMDKVRRLEEDNRRHPTVKPGAQGTTVTYRGYGDDFTTELRPTGHPVAPYVGLLRYTEHVYSCVEGSCAIASTIPVTEIFRFQDGRWVY
jgi:hypothetical protein